MRRRQGNFPPRPVVIPLTIARTIHRLFVQQTLKGRPFLMREFPRCHFGVLIAVGKVVSTKFSSGVLLFNDDVFVHSRDGDRLGALLQTGPGVGYGSHSGRVVVLFVF